jgi:CubicO group peptidase (beta-lactamase class C family)
MKIVSIGLMMFSTSLNAAPLMEAVKQDLQHMVERDQARAIVVGLYHPGDTTVQGFGRISRSNPAQPTGDTVFEIGSISKVFTVLLTEALVRQGALNWDDSLAERLPGISFASSEAAAVTLAELAGHVSGLPRLPDNMPMEDPLDPYAGYDRALLEAFLAGYSATGLDKRYAYSNLGLGILGEIAADAAGMSYGAALGELVFSRFAMPASGVTAKQPERLAQAFSDGADMANWGGFDALAGAGALVSSTNDLLNFVAANLAAEDPLLIALLEQAGRADTAFGWHRMSTASGAPVYWHNGGTGGYASFLAIRPDTQTGVVILTASTEYDRVTELGIEQISGTSRPAARLAADQLPPVFKTIDMDPALLADYEGEYQLAPGAVIKMFARNGQLFTQLTGQPAFPVFPYQADRFYLKVVDAQLHFERGADGEVTAVVLHQNGQQRAERQ